MPERYRQERLLFSLFSEGLSCLECFYYGFYFVGAMCDPATFDPEVDRRSIGPARVAELYLARFGGDQLTASMLEVLGAIKRGIGARSATFSHIVPRR